MRFDLLRLRPRPVLAAALLSLALAATAAALQKTPARAPAEMREDRWLTGGTCSIAYYNLCSGWVWIWSGWDPGERFGIAYGPVRICSDIGSVVTDSFLHVMTGSPAGYGFTGTVSVEGNYPDPCPDDPGPYSQPFLPTMGWNHHTWYAPVYQYAVVTYTIGPAPGNPCGISTDQASALGPTGEPACGSCFPESRQTHSYRWGTEGSPICPGIPFEDDLCPVELLAAIEGYVYDPGGTISVESSSWGKVKSLFR
jgi:hypothetical protein